MHLWLDLGFFFSFSVLLRVLACLLHLTAEAQLTAEVGPFWAGLLEKGYGEVSFIKQMTQQDALDLHQCLQCNNSFLMVFKCSGGMAPRI